MEREPQTPVEAAVRKVGGRTAAALLLQCSSGTIHRMISEGRMPTDTPEARERVLTLAKESGESVLALVGLETPAPRNGRRKGGKGGPGMSRCDTVARSETPPASLLTVVSALRRHRMAA